MDTMDQCLSMEGGAPLHETLEASFPRGLMPDGLEADLKHKVRKRIRDFAYRVNFPEDEPWEHVVESFAIATTDRLHRTFGDNPWFWVVAWPGVLGAAAADFFPQISTGVQRRSVAMDATAAHLEALLLSRALAESGPTGSLPAPAVLGLKAIGQSTLPALPNKGVPSASLMGGSKSETNTLQNASNSEVSMGYAKQVWKPPPLPSSEFDAPLLSLPQPLAPGADDGKMGAAQEEPKQRSAIAVDSQVKLPSCTQCCQGMEKLTKVPEAYVNSLVICDSCHDPCSPTAETAVETQFWHCADCQYDLCKSCALSQQPLSAAAFGGS